VDEHKARLCKFCGVECVWSDRGRADCYICGDLRARLSEMARVQREWSNMVGELMRVQAENQQLRADLAAARLARVEADAAGNVDELKRQLADMTRKRELALEQLTQAHDNAAATIAAERARSAELEAALGDLVGRMADVEENISDAAWNELSPLAEQAERVLRNVTPLSGGEEEMLQAGGAAGRGEVGQ